MRARTLRVLIVASFCVAARVAGQSAGAPDLRMLFLRSMKAGQALRVSGHDVGTITGSFAGVVRDSALVFGGGGVQAGRVAPIAGIDSIWVGNGHASSGILVGSVVGLVVAREALSGNHCDVFTHSSCLGGLYLEFFGITAGGALVGGLIGSGIRSWHLRFP
jgi:hypothetical protein